MIPLIHRRLPAVRLPLRVHQGESLRQTRAAIACQLFQVRQPGELLRPGRAADVGAELAADPAQALLLDHHQDRGTDVNLVARTIADQRPCIRIENVQQRPGLGGGGPRAAPQARHAQRLLGNQDLQQRAAARQTDAARLTDTGELGLFRVIEHHRPGEALLEVRHLLPQGGDLGLRAFEGLPRAERRAGQALAEAEAAQKVLEECARQGRSQKAAGIRAGHAWRKAERAMDAWQATEQIWQRTKGALPLITPEGELNTRATAEAVLARTLPQLPDRDFAKTKRQLQRPEMLNYLDRVHERLAELPFPEGVTQAAVQQEALRRRPELLKGEGSRAAAWRGVLLLCAVVLGQAEQGQQAVAAVREIFRRAYRASSVVECINSVLRMQQAQHRKLTQGLLDLKRLYWNCHTFRTGHRRGTTPYQRLGVPWPEGLCWRDVLKLTPEQLRNKLSTANKAA